MKFLVLITLIFSFNIYSQDLIGPQWLINKTIGYPGQDFNEFILWKNDNSNKFFRYGNNVTFEKDNTFKSTYTAWCGLDCFPYSAGTFKMNGRKSITLFVKNWGRSGYCESEDVELNLELGTYRIYKISKDSIKLVKKREHQVKK